MTTDNNNYKDLYYELKKLLMDTYGLGAEEIEQWVTEEPPWDIAWERLYGLRIECGERAKEGLL